MNITQEQYNTVLDGLRTQLEIQRAFNKELMFSRDRFKEAYSNNIEQADKTIKAFQQEKEEAAKQIEQLKVENFNLSKELNTFTEAYNTLAKNNADINNAHTMTLEEHNDVIIALKSDLHHKDKQFEELRNEYIKLSDEFERYKQTTFKRVL